MRVAVQQVRVPDADAVVVVEIDHDAVGGVAEPQDGHLRLDHAKLLKVRVDVHEVVLELPELEQRLAAHVERDRVGATHQAHVHVGVVGREPGDGAADQVQAEPREGLADAHKQVPPQLNLLDELVLRLLRGGKLVPHGTGQGGPLASGRGQVLGWGEQLHEV